MTRSDQVAVAIVTHNSAADLPACLAALAAQTLRPTEVVVVDNASSDDAAVVASEHGRRCGLPLRVLAQPDNLGFSVGMNLAIAATTSPWILTLNADALLDPQFLANLLDRAAATPNLAVGAMTGRLRRFADLAGPPAAADAGVAGVPRAASIAGGAGPRLARPTVEEVSAAPPRLDACGMFLTPAWRHFDRGSDEVDRGQFGHPARVFGGTGAATLFRRAALVDSALETGAVFDPDFFTFREDAELAFRLRERGWEVLYEPTATAAHRRANLPRRRRAMSALVNYHTFKNRFLLRLYHQTADNLWRHLVPTLGRDLLALGWVAVVEHSSLPALAWLWRERRRLLARRRFLQRRRTVPPAAIDVWFRVDEQALPGAADS